MPITVPDQLPAKDILTNERVFIMGESRAFHQDIRTLEIGILNLMPLKEITEVQILRLLANTPLQINITLVAPITHAPKNTSMEHLISFYQSFDEIKHRKFDGFIITGAPIEQIPFESVDYWEELKTIMDWTKTNVTSTFHICWGAQAALYHHYGIPKYPLAEKMFGVFSHNVCNPQSQLLRGFDDKFYAPHSRHTEIRAEDVQKHEVLEIIADSDEAGVYIIRSKDGRQIFVMGHSEYDPNTLRNEYERDLDRGLEIEMPMNYFKNDEPSQGTLVRWRSHASLLFANWVNYYVYQVTPYQVEQIASKEAEATAE